MARMQLSDDSEGEQGCSGTEASNLVFLGTYTDYDVLPHWPKGNKWGEGITVCRWQEEGKLQVVGVTPCLNPAFMKYHPTRNVLYVLSECIHTEGYLTAYSVDPFKATLTEIGRVSMTGRSTCYISFDKDARHAVICNYWDGRINVVELDSEGVPLRVVFEHQQTRRATWRQVTSREDHMANRQDGPHAHCTVFHPTYKWLFVPDLGDNCIYQYAYDAATGALKEEGHVPLSAGYGPRHFVFHPTLPVAYSGCELRSHVQVLGIDVSEPESAKLRMARLQEVPTLPEDFTKTNYVGEIRLDHDGRFLYVSNRGHHSIAVFAVDQATGLLTRMSIDLTLGKTPRHFGLSPCGGFLVAANQDCDVVKVFKRCRERGSLDFTGYELPMPTPNFVLFAKPHLSASMLNNAAGGAVSDDSSDTAM